MLIWCSAAFFPQNQKHNWKKKFYLLSLFLLPRILKHYSQYTRAMCREYIFFLLWMKGRTIQVCWYYTGLLYSPYDSPTLYDSRQQPFLFMLLIYYVNQLTPMKIFAVIYSIRLCLMPWSFSLGVKHMRITDEFFMSL